MASWASAADPALILRFDSGANVDIEAFYNGSVYLPLQPNMAQIGSNYVWGTLDFQEYANWPDMVLRLGAPYQQGGNTLYSFSYAAANQDILHRNTYTVAVGDLTPGTTYKFLIGMFLGRIYSIPASNSINVKMYVKIQTGLTVVADHLMYDRTFTSADDLAVVQEFDDTLNYDFDAVEGHTMLSLRIEVRPKGGGAASAPNFSWFGFSDAILIEKLPPGLGDLNPNDPEPLPELPTIPGPEDIIGLEGMASLLAFFEAWTSNRWLEMIRYMMLFSVTLGLVAYLARRKTKG